MNEFAVLGILCLLGVSWGASAIYLIQVRDYALTNEVSFRSRYSSGDHGVELVIGGFCGFLAAVLAYDIGLSPALTVFLSSFASFINRSGIILLIKYLPIVTAKLHIGTEARKLRDQKIEALERDLILETRSEERMRIQAQIAELRQQ